MDVFYYPTLALCLIRNRRRGQLPGHFFGPRRLILPFSLLHHLMIHFFVHISPSPPRLVVSACRFLHSSPSSQDKHFSEEIYWLLPSVFLDSGASIFPHLGIP